MPQLIGNTLTQCLLNNQIYLSSNSSNRCLNDFNGAKISVRLTKLKCKVPFQTAFLHLSHLNIYIM